MNAISTLWTWLTHRRRVERRFRQLADEAPVEESEPAS